MAISPHASIRRRIHEITILAKGNRREAERLVRVLIEREPKFLRELVDPYLNGIIAHALLLGEGRGDAAPPRATRELPADRMDSLLRGMRENLGAQPASSTGSSVGPPAGGKVSESHADTIKALAAAQAARKRRTEG